MSQDVREGRVATQVPNPGSRLRRGKTVKVSISEGIQMPSFSGKTLDYTLELLRDYGATPKVESLQTDEVSKGKVVSTNPAAGEKLPIGEYVTVTVSIGRKTCPHCHEELKPSRGDYCGNCGKRIY